jgi:predicted NBD/HSP70 family sugar kinase
MADMKNGGHKLKMRTRADNDSEAEFFGTGLSGTNLERGSVHNQRVTLQAIRVNGAISKAELAEITGLTPPAVASIAKRLLDQGLVVEAGRVQGARGQPALRLAINADGAYSIGINIDRDHVTLVMLDFMGKLRHRVSREIAFALPRAVTDFVTKEVAALKRSNAIDISRLTGIGVAIPDDLGHVDLPHRPKGYEVWSNIDLKAALGQIHPTSIHIANDATAAALGELRFGYGQRNQSFFYVLISAGLGGGLVIDGHPVQGAHGRSGEIGFLPAHSRRGRAGNLQEVVSLSGLFTMLATAGFKVDTVAGLGALGESGNAACRQWINKAASLLAEPLLAVNAIVDPEAIYIGGRLPVSMIESLSREVAVRLQRRSAGMPAIAPVKRAALAEDAAAMGAAILPFSERFLPVRSALMKQDQ